jgi:Ser/Thr protein kinase RdoA (MazF antagonist)
MAQQVLLEKILTKYGLKPVKIDSRQMGYRNHSYCVTLNTGQLVNLIIYKREPGILPRIRRANIVSDYLAGQGFPTRRTIEPGIIRLTSDNYLRYAAVYTYLPGNTVPWEAYTRRHLKLLGSTMSNIHHSLSQMPNWAEPNSPTALDEYASILQRMIAYFQDPGVIASTSRTLNLCVASQTWKDLTQILKICRHLPEQQILHLDFVRGNILFEPSANGPRVSGIIDFEKTALGPPVMDIARTLSFLLVDSKFKTNRHIRKYFLQSGYAKRGSARLKTPIVTVSGKKIDTLERLVDLFLVHDFYKFLRHNPYDSLHLNEHYVRTKQLLLDRGILSPAPDPVSIAEPAL